VWLKVTRDRNRCGARVKRHGKSYGVLLLWKCGGRPDVTRSALLPYVHITGVFIDIHAFRLRETHS
jgi:hypothetical protein